MFQPNWCRLGDRFIEDFAAPNRLPFKACHVGPDALTRLTAFVKNEYGRTAWVISDDTTYRVAGEEVCRALNDAGKVVHQHRFSNDPLDATGELADALATQVDGADFLVAVGSGTVSDLAKYAAHTLKRPVVFYPTAASMNGYTSGIAALKVDGLKRTLPCTPAEAIFANPEHVATAPSRMTAAGVADFLSKCSSTTDWRASHILLDVPFDPRAREFFDGIQDQLLDCAPKIGQGDPEAIALALEALLLSGFSMIIAGSSAPASGGEHLISHYLDMKSALYDTPHDLHGTQVGVATVHCLGLWERVLAMNPEDIDVEDLVARQIEDVDVRQAIEQDWGAVAPEVQEQWDTKKMAPDQLRVHLQKFVGSIDRLRQELPTDLLPAETVRRTISDSGGPVDPEELNAPLDEYRNALQRARYIRDRFTILDLAQDLGLS